LKNRKVFILGTMGNLLCIMAHCSGRSEEVIVGDKSHIFVLEQGNVAHVSCHFAFPQYAHTHYANSFQLAGVQCRTLKNFPDGTFDPDEMAESFRPTDQHHPETKLVCIENTHNICGGKSISAEWVEQV
jgi:threonine aldolase